MMDAYHVFREKLDHILSPLLEKNIIIYGYNRSGDFIRWFLEYYYSKKIKAFVDRWAFSPANTVLHLWCFYYIYEQEDIILNVTPYCVPDEFNDTGELWSLVKYQEEQIINLWDFIYDANLVLDSHYPKITYYEWLEVNYNLDLTKTIRRQFVDGNGHGYFPTDFRMIHEGIGHYQINPQQDCILDIGSGKGAAVLSFLAAGFQRIGAVEYTQSIYGTLIDNLEKMGILLEKRKISSDTDYEIPDYTVFCYQGDAAEMKEELDRFNWFFMFNPFPKEVFDKVLKNICESHKRHPRQCHIFYAEPIGHQMILDTGIFEQSGCVKSDYSDISYYAYIYDSKEVADYAD